MDGSTTALYQHDIQLLIDQMGFVQKFGMSVLMKFDLTQIVNPERDTRYSKLTSAHPKHPHSLNDQKAHKFEDPLFNYSSARNLTSSQMIAIG